MTVRFMSDSFVWGSVRCGKRAQHLDDFPCPLTASDDDDDIDGRIFGEVVLQDGLAGAKWPRRTERSPFQDGKLGIDDPHPGVHHAVRL